MANLPETEDFAEGTYQIETSDRVLGGPGGIANKQGEQLGNRTAWLRAAIAKIIDGTTAVGKATQLAATRTLKFKGAVSGSGSYDGTGDTEIALTLVDSGVAAGTYTKVTINVKGLVTGASNPTTLAGYGITDAFTKPETASAIQQAISSLVASSPAALDTLNELAAALGNDPNFATTMTNALAGKAAKATTLSGYGITDAFTKPETASAIQQAISNLVASSPAALDTLKELAAALGNDPNFATTMTNALAAKANKATTIAGYGITDALTVGSGGWLGVPAVVSGTIAAVPSSQLYSAVSPNTTDTPSSYPNTVGMHMIFANTSFGADIAVSLNDNIGNLLFRNLGPNASGWRKVWHDGNFTLSSKISGTACSEAGFASSSVGAPFMRHTDGTVVRLQVDRPKDTASFAPNGFSKNADTGEITQRMEVAIGDIPAGGRTIDITWPFAFPNAFVHVTSIVFRSADATVRHISNGYYSMGSLNGCRLQIDEAAQTVQPSSLTAIVTAIGN